MTLLLELVFPHVLITDHTPCTNKVTLHKVTTLQASLPIYVFSKLYNNVINNSIELSKTVNLQILIVDQQLTRSGYV